MIIEMVLSSEEIKENIPYSIICLTRCSSDWNTMKRKLRWNNEFSTTEQKVSEEIFRQAYHWFINGVPNKTRMDFSTFELWNKIAEFCISL